MKKKKVARKPKVKVKGLRKVAEDKVVFSPVVSAQAILENVLDNQHNICLRMTELEKRVDKSENTICLRMTELAKRVDKSANSPASLNTMQGYLNNIKNKYGQMQTAFEEMRQELALQSEVDSGNALLWTAIKNLRKEVKAAAAVSKKLAKLFK